MARIYIAGAMGFIGSHLCHQLTKNGHKVLGFDHFVASKMSQDRYRSIIRARKTLIGTAPVLKGDVKDLKTVKNSVAEFSPEIIVHLANSPSARLLNEDPYNYAHDFTQGTLNLLHAASECPSLERFCYISSSMVYGDNKLGRPHAETDTCHPNETYGTLKLACENLTRNCAQNAKFDYTIVRPMAVYGPYNHDFSVVTQFIKRAQNGKPLTICNTENRLAFTFVADLASAIASLCQNDTAKNQTYNVCAPQTYSIQELAESLKPHFKDLAIEHHTDTTKTHYPLRLGLNPDKFLNTTNFNFTPLSEGIAQVRTHLCG